MSMHSDDELERQAKACRLLITDSKTLLLSTRSKEGQPDISYAPYVQDEAGTFYIYVSELAAHTVNLLQHKQAAVLFIRPEDQSPNLFARERASFHCAVDEIKRDSPCYIEQLGKLAQQHGEVVSLLSRLPDFHLLALKPESGRYVVGFGKAFTVVMDDFSLKPIAPGEG